MPFPSVPLSEPLPLDAVGSALVAFGMRKLRSAYAGNCVEVTRSSDNGSANAGFTSEGDLDEAAIATHVGANNGTIRTWYDQSGNSRNATNSTVSEQPTLVSSGVVKRNHGKPVAEFRGDTLSIALGTTIANDALTIVAVVQSRTELTATNVTWLSMPTNKLEIRMNSQSVRVWSWGGGAVSQTTDPVDRAFCNVRPLIVAVRLDATGCDLLYNNVLCETFTLTNHGDSGSTLQLVTATAGHDCDISELIAYDRVVTDAELTTLYKSLNQYHSLGPDDPLSGYYVRNRWPADSVLQKWIRDLTEAELTVTRGNLSWDDTYADTDELMRIYLVFVGGKVNYSEHLRALLAHPVWFRLKPDSGGSGGMDTGAAMRHFEAADHGTEAGTLALFYANSLPKDGGAEGNPYYRQEAVGLRSLVCGAYSLMAFMTAAEKDAGFNHTDFIGGNLMASAFAFQYCKEVAPLHVQAAYKDMLYLACQKLWWLPAHDANGNMDIKSIAGLARSSACFEREDWRTTCAEAARNILFGSRIGTAATSNKLTGLYSPAGYVDEGDSPETTYNGHSLNWMQEAYRVTYGDPLWSFLTDVVEDMIAFKSYQYFPDPDGYVDGPSGYAGRTGNSYVFDQGTEAWRQHNSAAISNVGRHLGDTLGDETSVVAAINSMITQWNSSVDIDDDCVLVSGTAAAHTNGSSSTTVTLTNSPDLSGLSVDNGFSGDWRAYLWLNINGGTWSQLTAFDDTANTITGDISFNIASGAAVDYRIEKGPKLWGANDTWWPPENYYPVPDGYYDAQRALIVAADASLQTPWESSATHNVNFGDEFWSYKNNDGSRDFGFFVEAVENSGAYSGWYGGTLQQFWTRDTGTVICARHNKAGEDYPLENTRWFPEIDSWATTHVYGIDDADKAFSTAALNGVVTNPSSTFDINGTPKSVEHEATIQGGATDGFEAGTSITGTIFYRNTFEALADGVRHLVEVTYTGSDDIKELWATIPVYLRDTDQSMSDTTIEYWNGSSWATLSTTLVSTDAIRLMRNFGSGDKYAYIEFATSQSVKLNAAVWVQTYQGNSRHRMIKVNILGATPDGTGKPFPAAPSVDYSVVTTDPHP